ncbi:hypothetical protein X551_04498 [Methylibium sp. T29]|nr:hypothetical protein X551_04498 [Methylibium sp. T29]EWS57413.1 hypothetical protein Y694_04581 [Methylibium sp. T29-B]
MEARRLAEGVAALEQAHQRGGAELAAAVHVAVFARHHVGEFAAVDRHAQSLVQPPQQRHAALLVADVPRQQLRRGAALAEVVAEAGVAHRQRRVEPRTHVQHHHQVHAGVDLGVVFGALRHAPQPRDLGQQPLQCAAFAQQLEHARRARLHQAAREFLPHAFGDEVVDLAAVDHAAHQGQRLGCDGKPIEARREACDPQDAHRVLGEGRRHVAEHTGCQVALAAVGVDQRAVGRAGDGVDGQVAPCQVLFQRHVRCGVEAEAVIARTRLAFGACECVLLVRLRVQEDREVASDRQEAGVEHLLRCAADDHPVPVSTGDSQQFVADGAADNKNLSVLWRCGDEMNPLFGG